MLAPIALALCLSTHPAQEPASGGYLVVEVALERGERGASDDFAAAARSVAREAAAFHEGRVVTFDGEDWEGWRRTLRRERPDEVLFVVPPGVLDLPLHRRILLASTDLDEDPLPDFTWGYFTAADGEGLRQLWTRTRRMHESGLEGRLWFDVGVASNMKSRVYEGSVPDTAGAAGFTGDSVYFGTVDNDPRNLAFVDEWLPHLEQAAVIEFTGNGDPEGIWLFPGGRNLDPSLHWDYDPGRVGEDPKGEMPRVMAERFAALELAGPVVWSGTCHSAATRRVYVEGDIVSTFGRTERTTLHELPPERSLCLAMLSAGATAYLAPLGANHGMAVSRERDVALTRGCSLGEAVKSTWDDVFLAAGGTLTLDLPVAGEPHRRGEPVMQGGGANRVLIGDPALRPFAPTAHPAESVAVVAVDGGVDVTVTWLPGWHSLAWDMYGTDGRADWRVVARVELPQSDGPAPEIRVELAAEGVGGEPMPYALRHAVVESWRGRRVLHLQASASRAGVEREGVTARFEVRWSE